MDGRQLQQQYKHHISDYKDWDQRDHATEWMVFEKNMGTHLSIDETALSSDELYTVVTNKSAKGQKGAIVAVIKGTQADKVIEVLLRINKRMRQHVKEVTMDMAATTCCGSLPCTTAGFRRCAGNTYQTSLGRYRRRK
jgi:hypothetical protein